jgi:hypothetical protein
MTIIDTSNWQLASELHGDSPEDTALLKKMYLEASSYLNTILGDSIKSEMFIAQGVGDIIALFYVKFKNPLSSGDTGIWIVVGDIPSAYFVVDRAQNASEAFEVYCELMDDWAQHVLAGKSLDDVFPIDSPATNENANDLIERIRFIRRNFASA